MEQMKKMSPQQACTATCVICPILPLTRENQHAQYIINRIRVQSAAGRYAATDGVSAPQFHREPDEGHEHGHSCNAAADDRRWYNKLKLPHDSGGDTEGVSFVS